MHCLKGLTEMNATNAMSESNVETSQCCLCTDCDRSFKDAEGLQQHRRSKHGLFQRLLPEWANSNNPLEPRDDSITKQADEADESSEQRTRCECVICGQGFADSGLLEEHLNRGGLPASSDVALSCERCSRSFHDRRALCQHMNFCTLMTEDDAKCSSSYVDT